jgi:2-hydroxychromene-2-carboxylate isomerase
VIAIVAAGQHPDGFMRRVFSGIWEEERNLGDPAVVAEVAEAAGHDPAALLPAAQGDMTEAVYALNLENAIAADVFGSPAYVIGGEVFWGQDRLDLLDDALKTGRAAYSSAV